MATVKNTAPGYWAQAKRHLTKVDPVLGAIIRRYKGESLASRGSAFFSLARAIVGQQISVKAAQSVWNRLEAGLGGEVLPERILAADTPLLRSFGLSGQKVIYLQELSQFFVSRPRLDWHSRTDGEIIADLVSIKGIGTWSAEMFLMFHLMRPDVFSIADLGLRKAVEKHYNNGGKMSPKEILTLAQRWAPYRTVASWYLWRSLDPVPVEY